MGKKKKRIDWAEFKGNYGLTTRGAILAMIEAYRKREIGRAELRVYAAVIEAGALHEKSRVGLYRIVNCKSGSRGVRRMSEPEIERAREMVGELILSRSRAPEGSSGDNGKQVCVARKFARHIAQGRCTCVEAVMLLYYSMRRLPQRRPLQRLAPGQRYARFRYAELEALSGIPKANLSRGLRRLRERGFLDTQEVAKQNENEYGLLFVDGHLVSLTPRHLWISSDKTTTPSPRNDNTPHDETTTLINKNPKTSIREREAPPCGKIAWRPRDADMLRLVSRANAMLETQLEQAA